MKKLAIILFLFPMLTHAQTVCSLESKAKLEEYLNQARMLKGSEKTLNELNITIGQWMLETPYVEKTLEIPGEERLVINLLGLDCTTFLETVMSIARTVKNDHLGYESYELELGSIRYRNGNLGSYPSRLHYFSDWIYENEQKGFLVDITKEIGGKPYVNQPTFMSLNPQYYPQLVNKTYLEEIKSTEQQIASRDYYFIPKAEISKVAKRIQSGDIIAITSSLSNLDIVHVGFAIEKDGQIHLLHASTKSMKVEISSVPLADYIQNNKSQTGIMVARMVD